MFDRTQPYAFNPAYSRDFTEPYAKINTGAHPTLKTVELPEIEFYYLYSLGGGANTVAERSFWRAS